MKTRHFILVLVALLSFTASVSAQSKKTIYGQIRDASNRDFLPGAAIYLEGTHYATISDIEGNFVFFGIPPGLYTLKVSYIGYDAYSAPLSISESQEQKLDIDLKPTFIELHGVEVVGQRQGQMKALNMQKEAAVQMNIVAKEQMERFPDLNTAEVLQRLPGVTISKDLGEGKFVSIRGTDPRFTQIKVNGEAIATSEDVERYQALNVISATQLSSIEVTKTPTPRMDGDAIGGVVDLKTRSAFDSDRKVLRVTAGGGYSDMAQKPNARTDISYATQFGKSNQFGISLNANYQLQNMGANGIEPRWSNKKEDINFNPLPTVFNDIEIKHYRANRTRYGAGGDFEFRPNATTKFKIGGMYNLRNDLQARNTRRVRAEKGMFISADTIFNARAYYELHDRLETQEVYALNAGGEHHLDWLKIDYNVAYSHGKQEKIGEGQIKAEFQSSQRFTLVIDPDDHVIPRFKFFDLVGSEFVEIPESSILDPEKYVLDQLDWRTQHTTNSDLVAAINFTIPYNLGNNPGNIQFGSKIRQRGKDRDNERIKNGHTDYNIPMMSFLGESVGSFLNGNYQYGPLIDPVLMRDYYETNAGNTEIFEQEYRWVESLGETYLAKERVIAGYGMFQQIFNKMLIIGGLRVEQTLTDYTGQDLNLDSNGAYISSKDTTDSRTYVNFFPNIQARYRLTPNTNIRLAFTTGIMRPNYYSLVPYYIVSDKDRSIWKGNSELLPTRSANLDFSVEHYFQKVGIISVAIFAKQLEDLAFIKISRDTIPGDYFNWELRQELNGGSAHLLGFELNWAQQFTFLPGFADGFGVYINYTHNQALKSEIFERNLGKRIPGLSPDVGNIALTYEKYGFTGRLAYNFNMVVLQELGEIEDEDIYSDVRTALDFSSAYKITRGLEFFLEVNNILNSRRREYYGIPERTYRIEYYSFAINAGIKWTLR